MTAIGKIASYFESSANRPPQLSEDGVAAFEDAVNGPGDLAVARRLGLWLLTFSGGELIELAHDREAAISPSLGAGQAERCAKAMRDLAECLEDGAFRARLALCVREDLDAIEKEASDSEADAGIH